MSNPFDYVTAINISKKEMMTGTENDELAEADYNPYLTNKALSYFPDTILYANEMNIHHDADKKLQFQYLLNSVRPKKRYSKWVKRQDSDDFEAIKQYYGYSNSLTEYTLSLLTPDQVTEIKRRLNTGGMQ